MSAKLEAGQIEIKRFTLINSNRTSAIDVRAQLVEASFYEDITKPTLFCEITLIDGNNIRSTMPIIGEETFEVEFTTPQFDQYKNAFGTVTFKNTFKIYSIVDLSSNDQSKKHTYTLLGVSEEQIASANITVEKSYDGTIDSAIKDVANIYLGTSKNVITEQTKGTFPLVVPSFSPLKTIDWLRRRAVSPRYKSSSFLFFETRKGFHFRTIEGLIEEGMRNQTKLKYVHNPTIGREFDNKRRDELFNILSFEQQRGFDTVDKVQLGVLDSVTSSFDLLTKEFKQTDFDWETQSHSLQKLSKNAQASSASLLKSVGQTAKKLGNDKKAISYFLPLDSARPSHNIESSLGARQSYSILSSQQQLTLYVYGNTLLSAGDVVAIEILLPTKKVEKGVDTQKTEKSVIQGNFLITQLRHVITMGQRFEHRISMRVLDSGVSI